MLCVTVALFNHAALCIYKFAESRSHIPCSYYNSKKHNNLKAMSWDYLKGSTNTMKQIKKKHKVTKRIHEKRKINPNTLQGNYIASEYKIY